MINFPRSEPEFSQFLVREYFRLGSVDEVLKHYKFSSCFLCNLSENIR